MNKGQAHGLAGFHQSQFLSLPDQRPGSFSRFSLQAHWLPRLPPFSPSRAAQSLRPGPPSDQ